MHISNKENIYVIIVEYKRIKGESDLCMSDTRLPWRDSRATIYSGVVTREASKGMLHPILFEFTRETLARMGRAIRETWWSHRARTRSSGRRDARSEPGDYFRVIAQCIIIWGQPIATDIVRLPSRSPSAT